MPIADKKKVQTLINAIANNIETMRDAMQNIKDVRSLYTTANPDVTGTPLEGNLTTINNAINSLDTELQSVVWNGMINAKVPSHRGETL